jgi:hypothetical protein
MKSRNLETISSGNRINDAFDNAELIRKVFELQTAEKVYNPIDDPTATEKLKSQVLQWKDEGNTVVMVFGGFDAPFHVNHQQFLLDCKAHGVPRHYQDYYAQRAGINWEDLSKVDQVEITQNTLAEGKIKMIVSTDGDERISNSKGYNPKKGSSPRPLQGWSTRAHNLAGLSLQLDQRGSKRSPIVDAVTVHDHLALPNTIHAKPVDMVATFQPDVWTLYFEAETDIELARNDTRLSSMDVYVLQGDDYRMDDPLTGEPFSTTALVRRIKGE